MAIRRLLQGLALTFVLSAHPGRADPASPAPAPPVTAWNGLILHACENEEGYPPFAYRGTDDHPHGYTVDLLEEGLFGTPLVLDVAFLPPKRCDSYIEGGQLDLEMEQRWDPAQPDWLPSKAIYEVTPVMVYDRTRYPQGLTAAEAFDRPDQYRGCGVLGFDYPQFAGEQIDQSSHQYAEALKKMLAGRCSFFPEYLEFAASFRLGGQRLAADPRIGWVAYPAGRDANPPPEPVTPGRVPFFIYLRQSFPDSTALMARIDATILRWHRTGHDREVLGRYLDLATLTPER
jgi:hypothetical protein